MSGHSKWATIKHKKAKTDSQRGKVFTKIIKEITTAARIGGGDPNGNPRLRLAVDKAKEANMPNDNIDRAIAKGTGGGEGIILEDVVYEGYGPGGVAILVETTTDNKQRTVSEIRTILTKGGGTFAASGSVSYLFKKRGSIVFEKAEVEEEALTMAAIDAGAEDIVSEETTIEVITSPENFETVRQALNKQGFKIANAELTMVPTNTVKVTDEQAHKVLNLVNHLQDQDDVQSVHANFDIPDEIIEQES